MLLDGILEDLQRGVLGGLGRVRVRDVEDVLRQLKVGVLSVLWLPHGERRPEMED